MALKGVDLEIGLQFGDPLRLLWLQYKYFFIFFSKTSNAIQSQAAY
jgi:hypothetical protein